MRYRHVREAVTSGYWFIPTVMVCGAIGLALGAVAVDRRWAEPEPVTGWLYGGGYEGASTLLSTVAASIITVAGVVFSITISALTQASSQFGPRLLRNFMRDTGNQLVLGTFVATFVYCLLVLRTVHGKTADAEEFVPQMATTVAVVLATATVAVLIYFIHHVSASLQAPMVIWTARADLDRVIGDLGEDHRASAVGAAAPGTAADRREAGRHVLPPDFAVRSSPVPAGREGYVQAVDYGGLLDLAVADDLLLNVNYRPGDFVIQHAELARVWPGEQCTDRVRARLGELFLCGRNPTPEQDVEHAVRQMVEVAVRALSPGINDPFTASNCLDALGAGVAQVMRRGLPGPVYFDPRGKPRVVTVGTRFDGLVDTAFNQIRQNSRHSVAVMIRMIHVLAACGEHARSDEHRHVLLRHAGMVYRQGLDAIKEPNDLCDLREKWEQAQRALGAAGAA